MSFQVAIKKMSLREEASEELAVNEILAMRDNRNANIVTYLDRLGCCHVAAPLDRARQKRASPLVRGGIGSC